MKDSFLNIINKISSYQIFNYLLPGIIFVNGIEYTTSLSFPNEDIVFRFVIYYVSGMILSRIGSMIIGPLCKKYFLVVYSSYENYLKTLKKDKKLDILVKENNTYRTLIATFIAIFLIYVFDHFHWFHLLNNSPWSMCIYLLLLIILFVCAFRKQTSFIRKRVHHNMNINDIDELPRLMEIQNGYLFKLKKKLNKLLKHS